MKKLMALLLVSAVLLSFASCGKKDMTAEEYSEYAAAEESKKVAESVKVEEAISEKKEDLYSKVGKTEKNKRVVVRSLKEQTTLYTVYEMGKDCKTKYIYFYNFAPDEKEYQALVETAKNEDKYYDSDKKYRLVILRKEVNNGDEYDQLIEYFSNNDDYELIK